MDNLNPATFGLMNKRPASWPNPAILDAVKSLKWYAKLIADDVEWGSHRSKRLAVGMEFDQYRQYSPGDDLRLLDWKKYARTGKYYLRQSIQENAQDLMLIIDDSKSMAYQEDGVSKLDCAKVLSAAITYVLARQGDKFTCRTSQPALPMDRGMIHWQRSMDALYTSDTVGETAAIPKMMNDEAIWITDLYASLSSIEEKMKTIVGSNAKLKILHLMGRAEEALDFKGNLAFRDLETNERVVLSPKKYKERYRASLDKHYYQVTQLCYRYGVQYQKVYMQDDPRETLRQLLHNR